MRPIGQRSVLDQAGAGGRLMRMLAILVVGVAIGVGIAVLLSARAELHTEGTPASGDDATTSVDEAASKGAADA